VPQIFRNEGSKKKAVTHCVHMLRDLNTQILEQISMWLKIQEKIGIAKIRMYTISLQDTSSLSNLVKKLNYMQFVDVIYYSLNFSGYIFNYYCINKLINIQFFI